MSAKINKKITLELVGLDGNAFALMEAFEQQARREGWTKEEIKTVLDECQSGDYDHLLQTARREGWTKEEIKSVLDECQSGDYDHLLQTLIMYCE
jgi:sugar diacid utilization regulator